jgi:GTPase SAR1 family protein
MPVRNTIEVEGVPYLIELDATSDEAYLERYFRHGLLHDGGILLVYSIASRESLAAARAWAGRLRELQDGIVPEVASRRERTRPLLVLVGNKSDLDEQRQVTPAEGQALAAELGVGFVETTAKYPSGIRMPLAEAVRRGNEHRASLEAAHVERMLAAEPARSSSSISQRVSVFASLGKRLSGALSTFDRSARRKKQQQQQPKASGAGRGPMTAATTTVPTLGPIDTPFSGVRRVLKKKAPPPPSWTPPQPRVRRLDVDLGAPLDTTGLYEGSMKRLHV